jgi:valyl-tRNA synthetase
VVREGKVRFHPQRWEKVYDHWMTNIRDWCISRQIWWGHRIPVYYAPDGTSTAARNEGEARNKLGLDSSATLRQDEDVLDTWFSSWLWPFSILGWPHDNKDLRYFNPTDTLVTGPDIIFFWVARMIMANMEFMQGEPGRDGHPRTTDEDLIPFRDVYFTSIIRDAEGRKMSKSLGNSPDPLDVIDQYGADALRFTIAFLSPLGQDVLFSNEKCEIGRNFANKIWNAGRFLLMNKAELFGSDDVDISSLPEAHLDLADRWILSRLHHSIGHFNSTLGEFHLNESSKVLYDFIWHDFCDWYVELVKTRLYGDEPAEAKKVVLSRALWIFDQALRLLHPVMPFLTEELWQHLTDRNGQSVMRTAFPTVDGRWIDQKTEDEMSFVQNVINALRNIRGENNIAPSKEIVVQVRLAEGTSEKIFQTYDKYLSKLARVSGIEVLTSSAKPKLASSAVVDGSEIFVPLEGLIDVEAERSRLEKEIARLQQAVESTERKLANASFVDRAPKEVVEREREKLSSFKTTIEKLKANLSQHA